MANVFASDNNDIIDTFAKIFERKYEQNNIIDKIKEEDIQQIVGRVTQGSNEVDFEYLEKDHTKKFAWVMGSDGLIMFLKKSNIEAVRSLGLEDQWIRKKLEIGRRFRLGIFYKSDQCVPATWDGILSLIDNYYPKSISMKILQHADELKRMSFDEIEAQARLSYLKGASYFEVNGYLNDPRFMSEERLLECEGKLEECRGFLYDRLNVTRLFDGSGFTKDLNGQLHVTEYLQLNAPVRDLPGFRYLDIAIDSNDLMPDA